MFRYRIMSHGFSRARMARKAPIGAVESLEGRSLLSGLAEAIPTHGAAEVATRNVHIAAKSSGTAKKAPAFYENYLGPKRPELNLVAATGKVTPKGLLFTATVQGKINRKPVNADQESFYVFGIDRGSAKAVGIFPTRPGVRFDAVVVVSVATTGYAAHIDDVAFGGVINLDPKSIQVSGRTIQVKVKSAFLPMPEGGQPLARSRFGVWARSRLAHIPEADSYVASFLPENGTAPIGSGK